MVDVNMKLPPPKVIKKKACLQPKSPSKLSKDKNDCMNVENGGVHPKRYNGHCTKQ